MRHKDEQKSSGRSIVLILAAGAWGCLAGFAASGPDVTLAQDAKTATLSNGMVTAVVRKDSATLSSLVFEGTEMVDPRGTVYYSMDGGEDYDVPSGCVFRVAQSSVDILDVACKRTWKPGMKHAFDVDIHYVLRRGDTGIYSYAVLAHPAAYPQARVGEWRMVWKLPHDDRNYTLERAYVDRLRNWQMPSYEDYRKATPTPVKEIVKLNTGVRAGKYDCKYAYAGEYQTLGCWGHASDVNRKGAWIVLGGYDYFNDGPVKQDLTLAVDYNLVHFGRDHYNASAIKVESGRTWSKFFGPFLLYCNSTKAEKSAGNILCADARERTRREIAAWPYEWVKHPDYPNAAGRGSVNGRIVIKDALKPQLTAAGAWVGLAAPEESEGNWQFQSMGYQFWVRADAAGRFAIPAVRPGSYTLYAFADGAVGEFSKTGIVVGPGAVMQLGDILWKVPHKGSSLAWEIGVPDRTAKEFRHGNDYFEPYLWQRFSGEMPNPMEYYVGKSNPAVDWNYAQCAYNRNGVSSPWKWRVHFDLPTVPAAGTAVLTLAFAGADYARIDIYVNDEKKPLASVSPSVSGGNALIREAIHAKYCYHTVDIPVSRLRAGANVITLVPGRTGGYAGHVMYDSLSLELP